MVRKKTNKKTWIKNLNLILILTTMTYSISGCVNNEDKLQISQKSPDQYEIDILIEELRHSDTRQRALEELNEIGIENLKSIDQAMAYLYSFKPNKVAALGSLALPPCSTALDSHDPNLRQTAIEALVEINDPNAIESLCKLLEHQCYKKSEWAISHGFDKDWDPNLVQTILDALKEIDARHLPPAQMTFYIETLFKPLRDQCYQKSIWYRPNTDWEPNLIDKILDILTEIDIDNLTIQQQSFLYVFTYQPNKAASLGHSAVKSLEQTLQYPDAEVRINSVIALGKIKSPQVIAPLLTALNDSDVNVQQIAEEALVAMNVNNLSIDQQVRFYLYTFQSHQVIAMGIPAIDSLIKLLKVSYWEFPVYPEIVKSFVGIGKPAVQPLIGVLKDPKANVRQNAAEVLGQIGDPRAIEPLTVLLQNEDHRVIEQASQAIETITKAQTIDHNSK